MGRRLREEEVVTIQVRHERGEVLSTAEREWLDQLLDEGGRQDAPDDASGKAPDADAGVETPSEAAA